MRLLDRTLLFSDFPDAQLQQIDDDPKTILRCDSSLMNVQGSRLRYI